MARGVAIQSEPFGQDPGGQRGSGTGGEGRGEAKAGGAGAEATRSGPPGSSPEGSYRAARSEGAAQLYGPGLSHYEGRCDEVV